MPPQEQTRPPREQTPPGKQTPAYCQRAAGTHPTGMHSCLRNVHTRVYPFTVPCSNTCWAFTKFVTCQAPLRQLGYTVYCALDHRFELHQCWYVHVLYHYTLFLRDVHEMHHEKKLYITIHVSNVQLFFMMHFIYILKNLCAMVLSHWLVF